MVDLPGNDWWVEVVLLGILALLLATVHWFWRSGGRRLGLGGRKEPPASDNGAASSRMGPVTALLRQSGITGRGALLSLWAWKVFFAALFPVLRAETLMLMGNVELFDLQSILVGVIGFFTPELWLLRRRKKRRMRIESALSYFLDLTVALLRSGLALESALRRAGVHGFSGRHPLSDEVLLVAREMDIGKDRGAALMALADRTGVPDLRTVASAVRMGMKRGSPVEDALETQADALRAKFRERALRRLNSLSVVALLPVLLCGLPIFIVIVYFPAVIRILETFRLLGV
jgi:pilus assembly protein TadC